MKFLERRRLLTGMRRLGLVALFGALCACQTGLRLSHDPTTAKQQVERLIPLGTSRADAEKILANHGIAYSLHQNTLTGMERWPYLIACETPQGSFQLTLGLDDRIWGYWVRPHAGLSVPAAR